MNSKQKGGLCVGAAVAYFMAHGYRVYMPLIDSEKYDIVTEKRGYKDKTYHTKYVKGDFDLLFVNCSNGGQYLIPAEAVIGKSILSIGKNSWTEYEVHAGFA